MKIEDGEVRWFVVRVKTFADHGIKNDPDMRNKMKAEIPAWLDFLSNRKVFHARKTRSWFATEHIITEQLKSIIEATRNRVDRVVDGLIVEMFNTYKCWSFRMDVKAIQETIKMNGLSKYAIDELEIKKFLKDKKKMSPNAPGRLRYPDGFNDDGTVSWNKNRTARFFHFKVEDWLKEVDETQFAVDGVAADVSDDGAAKTASNVTSQQLAIPTKPETSDDLPF
jgi:hypothetical protein